MFKCFDKLREKNLMISLLQVEEEQRSWKKEAGNWGLSRYHQ